MRPNEFYTPPHIIEIARACVGGIDLDPASCELANETVGATRFCDIKQDGLKRPWFGNIFLNPPYSRFGPPFVRKAVEEFKSRRIEQAIILLNVNHIATHWFSDAMQVEHRSLAWLDRQRTDGAAGRPNKAACIGSLANRWRCRTKFFAQLPDNKRLKPLPV